MEGGGKHSRSRRPSLTKKQKWLVAVAGVLALALAGVIAWQLSLIHI